MPSCVGDACSSNCSSNCNACACACDSGLSRSQKDAYEREIDMLQEEIRNYRKLNSQLLEKLLEKGGTP